MPAEVDTDAFLLRIRQTRLEIAQRWGEAAAGQTATRMLVRLERGLARPVRAAILGEPNSGKTSLVNRLIGADLLTTDVIRNTRVPVLVRWGAEPGLAFRRRDGTRVSVARGDSRLDARGVDLIEVSLPRQGLQTLELMDTPGLDSLEEAPQDWLGAARSADVAVWCTLATQAWRASELAAWRALGHDRTASLLVTTRGDLLPAADAEKVRQRLEKEASAHFETIVVARGGSVAAAEAVTGELSNMVARLREARSRKAARIVGRLLVRLSDGGRHDRMRR